MSKNRIVNTKFWSDTYVSRIDSLEKLLFLYFITNQYTNICGIYEIPLKQIALDTGIDRDNLEKIFIPRLAESERIFYFDGWVYIKNFIKHQIENPSVTSGIKRSVNELPKNVILKIAQLDPDSIILKFIEDKAKKQTVTDCAQTVTDCPDDKKETDCIQTVTDCTQSGTLNLTKLNLTKPNLTLNGDTPQPPSKMTEKEFTMFWKIYPNRKDKEKAKTKFLKLPINLFPEIIKAVEIQSQSNQWQIEDGRFVPYATTWLNNKRWEDEIDVEAETGLTREELENKKTAREQRPFYEKLNELFKIYLNFFGADAMDTSETENFWKLMREDEDLKLCENSLPGTVWWEPITHDFESCKKLYKSYVKVLQKYHPESLDGVEILDV